MYSYIKGKCVQVGDGFVVIDNNGIGYLIYTSLNSIGSITGKDNCTLYTSLYLREGIMDLYGFSTEEERTMFLQLISISGVGPKAAISILSIAPPEAIALAILNGDSKLIQKAQGVGPKVAQRVVLELKDKLKGMEINVSEAEFSSNINLDAASEALSALLVLGYSENEAKNAIRRADKSDDVETIIKSALKMML